MASLKLNLTSVCVWYALAQLSGLWESLCANLYFFPIALRTIVDETATSVLGCHKYSTTLHMLQQIVFMHKLSASVFMRVKYTCVLP